MTDASAEVESGRKLLRDYGGAILVAVIVALFIRFFVIEAYRIPSIAMKPTLEPGDTVFVTKWPYGLRFPGSEESMNSGISPKPGEIVVFSPPMDSSRDYIKRVIGVAGDTVEIKKGRVILNKQEITVANSAGKNAICGNEMIGEASYGVCWDPPVQEDFGPEKVPEKHVFVLGDLRSQTPDSKKNKNWGLIPVSSLKGQALLIWLSIEPPGSTGNMNWFSRIRFERFFTRLD